MELLPEFDVYLRRDGVTFTARDVALLRAIDEHGSLNRAATSLGRSYSRAQQRVVELEDAFGELVERTRGGSGGGGSRLTERARTLESRFERLRVEFGGVTGTAETILAGPVVDRDGRIVTVETSAGTIRGLAPPNGSATPQQPDDDPTTQPDDDPTTQPDDDPTTQPADGEATVEMRFVVRADAVTLHEPSVSPERDSTSARNRLAGTVIGVDADESVALVTVTVGDAVDLHALVTTESIDRLALEVGVPVVASFKATATRGIPAVDLPKN